MKLGIVVAFVLVAINTGFIYCTNGSVTAANALTPSDLEEMGDIDPNNATAASVNQTGTILGLNSNLTSNITKTSANNTANTQIANTSSTLKFNSNSSNGVLNQDNLCKSKYSMTFEGEFNPSLYCIPEHINVTTSKDTYHWITIHYYRVAGEPVSTRHVNPIDDQENYDSSTEINLYLVANDSLNIQFERIPQFADVFLAKYDWASPDLNSGNFSEKNRYENLIQLKPMGTHPAQFTYQTPPLSIVNNINDQTDNTFSSYYLIVRAVYDTGVDAEYRLAKVGVSPTVSPIVTNSTSATGGFTGSMSNYTNVTNSAK